MPQSSAQASSCTLKHMRRMKTTHLQSALFAFSKTVPVSELNFRPHRPHDQARWPAGVEPSEAQPSYEHDGHLGLGLHFRAASS